MDRILTTHVGSLVRPPELVEHFTRIGTPDYDAAAHEALLTESIDEVVGEQADAGIDIVSDGEFRHTTFVSYLYERLKGIDWVIPEKGEIAFFKPTRDSLAFPELYADEMRMMLDEQTLMLFTHGAAGVDRELPEGANGPKDVAWAITEPLEYDTGPLERELAGFKAALEKVDVVDAFVPAIAPGSLGFLLNRYYDTEAAYLDALADVLNKEYKAIVDAGFMLQLDDPSTASDIDKFDSEKEFREFAQPRFDALNRALEGIPEDRVRFHMCWGSWHVPHMYDAPLSSLVDLVLQVNAKYYSLEMANSAHEHEYHVWEDVKLPDGKVLIPGVVTHHTTIVEHPELVKERIVRLANIVGRENVIAGTDCGFAQGLQVTRTLPSVQWAKLQRLAEGARLASKELWR